ncbi:MAG: DNA-binding protein [Syntrophales bacterium]|nr:DNA-binding protein [Syntrophales bacterium]
MQYSRASLGRVFILRLEDGEVLHDTVEDFAGREKIRAAVVIALGGADVGSTLVVGPAAGRATPIVPLTHVLGEVHEAAGVGTLFPDEEGRPMLHMHLSCGRAERAVTGCIPRGVKVWHVMEVIVMELIDSTAVRRLEAPTGFRLMQPC